MKTIIRLSVLLFWFFNASGQAPLSLGSITNLYDAFGKERPGVAFDFGFSCIINYNGTIILFDAGSNADTFARNVKALGIDLARVDLAVVSHSHFDHLNGMDYLLQVNPGVKIYYPNDIFWGADVPFDATGQEPSIGDSLPKEMRYFGGGATKFSIKQSGRFWEANVEYVKTSKEIAPGIKLIATTSPFLGYFNRYPNLSFVPGVFNDNKNNQSKANEAGLPELSLSLATPSGEILIVGCSHSSVEKITAATREFTKQSIQLLYGGFHLLPYKREEMSGMIHYLKDELGVREVAPAHCSGHLAFKMFGDAYGSGFHFAGLGETVRF